MRLVVGLLVLCTPAVATCPSCPEATLSSASPCVFVSGSALRTAIAALPSGCRVGFTLGSGTFGLGGTRIAVPSRAAARLVGSGPSSTILDGQRIFGLFDLGFESDLTVESMQLTGGWITPQASPQAPPGQYKGAVVVSGRRSVVTFIDCTITDMRISKDVSGSLKGGVFYMDQGSTLSMLRVDISNVQIDKASGTIKGGMIYAQGHNSRGYISVVLTNVHITGVRLSSGNANLLGQIQGGLIAVKKGMFTMAGGSISDVDASIPALGSVAGALMHEQDMPTSSLTDVAISHVSSRMDAAVIGQGYGQGGGFQLTQSVSLTLLRVHMNNITMSAADVHAQGGVFRTNFQVNLTLIDCVIENTRVYVRHTTPTMPPIASGGVAHIKRTRMIVRGTTLRGCRVEGGAGGGAEGGAIKVLSSSTLDVFGSTITGCRVRAAREHRQHRCSTRVRCSRARALVCCHHA